MSGPSPRVLYIAGSSRSGSTIVDNALGQVDGYFSGGEIRHLWRRGFLERRLCGCGEPLPSCATWNAVLEEAYGSAAAVDAVRMATLEAKFCRTRRVVRMNEGGRSSDELDVYVAELGKLYRAIHVVTGARVIVDSSKTPLYGEALTRIPGIELCVVHLVRDPRAVAYSSIRTKMQVDDGAARPMRRVGLVRGSLTWAVWNVFAERSLASASTRYMRLAYEDFATSPRAGLEAILELVGDQAGSAPIESDRMVTLRRTHTVSGNPGRFSTGVVEIRPDTEWTTSMPASQRLLVTAMTSPLLHRYGYAVRTKALP
jgi:Sulfotransferase family